MTSTVDITLDPFEQPTLVPADLLYGLDRSEQLDMQSLYESLFYIVEHNSRRSLGSLFGGIGGALLYCMPVVAKLRTLSSSNLGIECLLLVASMVLGTIVCRWIAGLRYEAAARKARLELVEIIEEGTASSCSDFNDESANHELERLLHKAYQHEKYSRAEYKDVIQKLYREACVPLLH